MLGIIGIGTLALLAMGGVATSYFLLADVSPVTANINELTSFGAFFGGVAGPVLGLLTFFGVIITLALQGAQDSLGRSHPRLRYAGNACRAHTLHPNCH